MNDAVIPHAPVSWGDWLESQGALSWLYPEGSLPPEVASSDWKPNALDKEAAWQFLIELRSRVATQSLAFRAGTEVAALDSIVKLFQQFRDVAKEHRGANHFALLTLQLLNAHVRPFTSSWHRLRQEGRLESVDFRVKFRTELATVQKSLRKGAGVLAAIAGAQLLGYLEPEEQAAQPEIDAPLSIALVEGNDRWKTMFDAELVEVRNKRAHTSDRECSGAECSDVTDGIGLALSGGGIRSATFSLGVLTVLARKGILSQVDYLSTVSGGGYLGAFISSAVGHPTSSTSPITDLFGSEGQPETKGPRALRDHSKYLIEGGIRTAATIAGLVTYGLVTTLLLVAPVLLLLAAGLRFVPTRLSWQVFVFLATLSLIGYGTTAIGQKRRSERVEFAGMVLGLSGLSLLLLAFAWYDNLEDVTVSVRLVGWIAIALALACFALCIPTFAKPVRQMFGSLVATLMIALGWLSITAFASLPGDGWLTAGLIIGATATFLITSLVIDLNAASPQRYYRDRLAKTYIITVDLEVKTNGKQKLSSLNASHYAPYHLLNAALNIPGSTNSALRGRRTDFFVFSKLYCGSLSSGIHPTTAWEEADPHLDLATAVATSGAAAAPNMGTNRASKLRYLLAMLNLRLCYWLKNPERRSRWGLNPSRYFWHELRGNMTEDLPYLNLSDGGHIENLGIYELLRRRCKFIIAVDGEADPQRAFGGLLTLVQLARIDFGIEIDPDLSDLRVDDQGIGRSHFELFRINYPCGGKGVLVYVKASMTGNESEFLQRYRKEHPDFPHESTAKQLYSERQFEAYRSLGEHVATELFRPDLVDEWMGGHVREWVRRLARHLLS
jgi:hypothetical protein